MLNYEQAVELLKQIDTTDKTRAMEELRALFAQLDVTGSGNITVFYSGDLDDGRNSGVFARTVNDAHVVTKFTGAGYGVSIIFSEGLQPSRSSEFLVLEGRLTWRGLLPAGSRRYGAPAMEKFADSMWLAAVCSL